ncbi:MAG: translation initiation factor IF-1 [Methylacidiphilales bacterium]|nr:translation initiation factor IF-1 [Candidatus Methylacidiphilales bacterium]
MPAADRIVAPAVVVEVLRNGACRVELANGHRAIARLARDCSVNANALSSGSSVQVQFHPYDLSRGYITGP